MADQQSTSKSQQRVEHHVRIFLLSIVFFTGIGAVGSAFAEPAAQALVQQPNADTFVDVWALRREAVALLGLPQEGDLECRGGRHEKACLRELARADNARQRALDLFNAKWLPALLRGMVKGDLIAETILRLCGALPHLQRRGIAADCSEAAEDRALALKRMREIGFQPAIQAFASNVVSRMRAPGRQDCGNDDSTDARRCGYLADTNRLRAILESIQTGNLAGAESWVTCNVSDRVVELDLILQECIRLNWMMMAVAAQAPRFYASGPMDTRAVGTHALTLARPPLSGQPAAHPYGRLFEGRREITRNDFSNFSDPQATERFYASLQEFIAKMQENIDADLRRDSRWAVFLIERINGGLFDAKNVNSPAAAPISSRTSSE
jgi:hypothetical protein